MKIYNQTSKNLSSLNAIQSNDRCPADPNIKRLLETFNSESEIPDLLDTEVAVYVPTNFGLLHRGWHRLSVTHLVAFFDRDYNVFINARLTWASENLNHMFEYADFIVLHVAKQNRNRFREIITREFFCDKQNYNYYDHLNDPYFAIKH